MLVLSLGTSSAQAGGRPQTGTSSTSSTAHDRLHGEAKSDIGTTSSTVAVERPESTLTTTAARAAIAGGGSAVLVGTTTVAVASDPERKALCAVGADGKDGDALALELEGLKWGGWKSLCTRFASYLQIGPPPYTEATRHTTAQMLAEIGYFRAVQCELDAAGDRIRCRLLPHRMVHEIRVDGKLPFVLLDDEIRRQVFIRPSAILRNEQQTLHRQGERITGYLQRTGFFDAHAQVRAGPAGGGAEPNAAYDVVAHVQAGGDVVLRNVRLSGSPVITAEEVSVQLRHYWMFWIFPNRFTPQTFEEDLDHLAAKLRGDGWPEARVTGTYAIDPKAEAADVEVDIVAGPKLVLAFTGNRALDDGDLRDVTTFQEARSTDPVETSHTENKIRAAYQKKGYFEAEVHSTTRLEKAQPSDIKTITFTIREGRQASLAQVVFDGVDSFKPGQISSGAELKSPEGGLFSEPKWVDETVEADEKAIARFYREHGFTSVRVTSERRLIREHKLSAVFHVIEGPRRLVRKVTFTGLPDELREELLRKRLQLLEQTPFIDTRLGADRRVILTELASRGYVKAEVHRRIKLPYGVDPGHVDIFYTVVPGPKSRFAGYFVIGNMRTARGVIGEEIGLDPGDPLDLVELGKAKESLRTLGVFSSVDINPLPGQRDPHGTWLLVELGERDLRGMDTVLSYATDDGFGVGADLRDNNLFGRAIHVDLSLRLSNASRVLIPQHIGNRDLVRGRLVAPHPFGLPVNFEWTNTYSYEDKQTFSRRAILTTTAVTKQILPKTLCNFCPDVVASFGYELGSNLLVFKEGASAALANSALSTVPNGSVARLVPKLSYSRKDSQTDPHSGYAGELRFEFGHPLLAGPIHDATKFWRFLASLQIYTQPVVLLRSKISETLAFGGPLVWATSVNYGMARPYGSDGQVPASETFSYGGDLSVRGLLEKASQAAFPLTNLMVEGSTELRWYFLEGSFGALQLAALSDVGFVAYHMDQLFDQPTVSCGGAFRYLTPVGPLSIAYAVPVVRPAMLAAVLPEVAPRHGRLHITFGYAF